LKEQRSEHPPRIISTLQARDGGASLNWAVIKLDSSGNEVWRYVYDGPAGSYDEAPDIVIDKDETIYVGGYSTGVGTNTDFTVIKLDSLGNEEWVYRYDGPASYRDELKALALDTMGNIYMTGWSWGIDWDLCVIKIDSSGLEQWVYRYNGPANLADISYDLDIDDSCNVYVCGGSMRADTIALFTVIKLDSAGNEKWRYLDAGPDDNGGGANCITLNGKGEVYVAGGFRNSSYLRQISVVKLASNGDTIWTYIHPHIPPSPFSDNTRDIVADTADNIYVTGKICVSSFNDDIVVMKFSEQGSVQEEIYNEPIKRNFNAIILKGGMDFAAQENCGLKVYDVTGRIVVNWMLQQNQKTFISLPSGVYFMKVEGRKNETIKKIIIL